MTDETGREIDKTEYMKRIMSGEKSGHLQRLETGDSVFWDLDLPKYFYIGGGTYWVTISKRVWAGDASRETTEVSVKAKCTIP